MLLSTFGIVTQTYSRAGVFVLFNAVVVVVVAISVIAVHVLLDDVATTVKSWESITTTVNSGESIATSSHIPVLVTYDSAPAAPPHLQRG